VSTTSPTVEAQIAPSQNIPREGALQRAAARLLGSGIFWALFLALSFAWPIVRVTRTALPPPLPVLESVPDFELADQNGRSFGSKDVRGRVWLLSTIETASPLADKLASELGKIQHRTRNLGPAFHLVTVGQSPENDTRENLAEFTSHHRVSPRMWSFLSGDAVSLRKVSAPSSPFAIALVDQKMRIRGRYDLADPGAVDLFLYHAGLLVNRGD
jgi:hypothetical protein